jgi:O-antigen/teichoic acid export membrane protein
MNTLADLKNKTIAGTIWNFLQQISRYGSQFITTFILAWYLVPEDFGLIAMIAVFFYIANSVMDSGISQALIRKKEVTQTDFSTAFYTNLVLGFAVYALLFFTAPFIADFYNETRLVVLVRVIGIIVIINSFQLVQVAILSRELNFKMQFWVILPASLLSSIIAIILAITGFGIWSLVAQMIFMPLTSAALYWIVTSWRPTAEFSIASFHELFGFGINLLIAGLIDTIYNNAYIIVIAKLFSATQVGYYFLANLVQTVIVVQISAAVQTVSYPALSTLQDNNQALKEFYRKIIHVVTYLIFPCMMGLIVLADPLFRLFLKPDWLPVVPYLQLLCIVGLIYPLHSINLNILKVKGRTDLFLHLEIIKKVIVISILIISIPFGIFGILIGQIIGSVLCYLPNCYFSIKLLDYPLYQQVMDFIPTLGIAVSMGAVMYLAGIILSLTGLLNVIALCIIGLTFYIASNKLCKMPGQSLLSQIIKNYFYNYKSARSG